MAKARYEGYSEAEDEAAFIEKLAIADRIVIQEFHASHNRSLVAGTREEAQGIKQKYAWWYDLKQVNYMKFKQNLISHLPSDDYVILAKKS